MKLVCIYITSLWHHNPLRCKIELRCRIVVPFEQCNIQQFLTTLWRFFLTMQHVRSNRFCILRLLPLLTYYGNWQLATSFSFSGRFPNPHDFRIVRSGPPKTKVCQSLIIHVCGRHEFAFHFSRCRARKRKINHSRQFVNCLRDCARVLALYYAMLNFLWDCVKRDETWDYKKGH